MVAKKSAAKPPAKKAPAKKAAKKSPAKKSPTKRAASKIDRVVQQPGENANAYLERLYKRQGWYEGHDAVCDYGPGQHPQYHPNCQYDDPGPSADV